MDGMTRERANKAIARLKRRIDFWKRKYDFEHSRFLAVNDKLGSALFREQDPKSGHLAEIMRLKGLMWKNGKIVNTGGKWPV